MHQIAVAVADQLHFDVARALEQLFEIHLVLAERRLGLALALRDFGEQAGFVHDAAHAATTAAPAGLEHQRVADFGGHALDRFGIIGQRFGGGHHRHIGGNRHVAGGHLVAQVAHGLGVRADKDQPRGDAGVDEFGAFRQQAIARVNGIGARELGDADIFVNLQIGLDRPLALADQIGLVGLEPVQGEFVFFGKHRHRLEPQLIGGAEDADGNFAAIGDENFLDGHG